MTNTTSIWALLAAGEVAVRAADSFLVMDPLQPFFTLSGPFLGRGLKDHAGKNLKVLVSEVGATSAEVDDLHYQSREEDPESQVAQAVVRKLDVEMHTVIRTLANEVDCLVVLGVTYPASFGDQSAVSIAEFCSAVLRLVSPDGVMVLDGNGVTARSVWDHGRSRPTVPQVCVRVASRSQARRARPACGGVTDVQSTEGRSHEVLSISVQQRLRLSKNRCSASSMTRPKLKSFPWNRKGRRKAPTSPTESDKL